MIGNYWGGLVRAKQSSNMERQKLNFEYNPRIIGIMEDDVLRPVFLFNFLITGYISGPSDINYRGYR